MHRAKPKAPLSIMEKRIPQNAKYKNTQSKIDSGSTVNKVRLISHKEFLKRRDETFRRITCRCLAELFSEYEDTGSASQPEMVARMVKGANGEFTMERVPAADEDNQEGCGPRIVSYEADEKEDYDAPYLVLDTRSKEEFASNRIHRAKNYPATFLNRDVLLPEMHQFKNQDSKLIVIYDLDDKSAAQTAHTLVQRGFDNIYVLTGGLIDYADEFPDHIEGTPLPPKPVDPTKKTAMRDVYKGPSALSSAASTRSVRSVATRRKGSPSDVSSVMSNLTVAESVISKATARKERGGGTANYR
ncbi:Centrosomal protein of 41 kDa [Phytophthora pseudosyringae]|uniref:Centrosomal protein of 41 kDa n=1 Tax=Phytophthora pseudosyringae TaxID=221518 RepID=A0A8T1VSZ3_9STRA|nr:Centrosomal protein of 41 kDa [Phytophthora pseudosyringae]